MDEENKKIENFKLANGAEKSPEDLAKPETKEKIVSPEEAFTKKTEEKPENVAEKSEKEGREGEAVSIGGATAAQKEREKKIENILEEDLSDIYAKMPAAKQSEFKVEGEKATRSINEILSSAKVKVGKILSIIKKWLSIIPGVNKFFLEQEAKIKTDKILKINQEDK